MSAQPAPRGFVLLRGDGMHSKLSFTLQYAEPVNKGERSAMAGPASQECPGFTRDKIRC
jgi:hypothetical protein